MHAHWRKVHGSTQPKPILLRCTCGQLRVAKSKHKRMWGQAGEGGEEA